MATSFYTTVQLMEDVPLTPNYEHTVRFGIKALQTQYFDSKVRLNCSFNFMSYQRHDSGVIRIQIGMELLDKVNYLRFVNANHEDKYFYAFITDMRYINDNCTEIDYKVDVLQTWWFDFQLNPCYVEREHSDTDELGDNLVPESLEFGDYVCPYVEQIDYWDCMNGDTNVQNSGFLIIATQGPNGEHRGDVVSSQPTTLYLTYCNNMTDFTNALNSYSTGITGDYSPIIAINMFPLWWTGQSVIGSYRRYFTKTFTLRQDFVYGTGPFTAFDSTRGQVKSYAAKNKKLLTYPYNFMVFESPDGSTIELKYENFNDISEHIRFCGHLSVFPIVETYMGPMWYELTSLQPTVEMGPLSDYTNPKYSLHSQCYPLVGTGSDAFSAWWAQNRYNYPIMDAYKQGINAAAKAYNRYDNGSVAGKLDGAIAAIKAGFEGYTQGINNSNNSFAGALAGGKALRSLLPFNTKWGKNSNGNTQLGGLADIATQIGQANAEIEGHKAMPSTCTTKASNAGIVHALEYDSYKVYYTRIRPEFAEIIDNYFTCFGYATHRVKVPNTACRRWWNYVKTVGCTLSPATDTSVPADAEEQIQAIFDHGVTIWHDPTHMYDYTLNNYILSV